MPAMTAPTKFILPVAAKAPAKVIISSEGIGMQADSAVISKKTAISP
jgi:hypothetical protein